MTTPGRVCSSCEAGDHAKCAFTARREAGLCGCTDLAHESGRGLSCGCTGSCPHSEYPTPGRVQPLGEARPEDSCGCPHACIVHPDEPAEGRVQAEPDWADVTTTSDLAAAMHPVRSGRTLPLPPCDCYRCAPRDPQTGKTMTPASPSSGETS